MHSTRITLLFVLAVSLFGCDSPNGTIEVRGNVTGEFMPDYYQIDMLITERGEKGPALVAPLEETLSTVLETAEAHGLEPEDIEADQFSLEQDSYYDRETRNRVPGEMVLSRQIKLNVDDPDSMPELMADLLQVNAVEIRRVAGKLENADEQQLSLLESATEMARTRAEHLAAGDGRQVGDLIEVSDFRSSPSVGRVMAMAVSGDRARPNVAFQEAPVTLDAEIRVIFELK